MRLMSHMRLWYHNPMSTIRQEGERVEQKRRTREKLVVAAAALMAQGKIPSVAEIADHAGLSRATAYRYFPSQEQMLIEAEIAMTAAADIERAFAEAMTIPDPGTRVDAVVRAVYKTNADFEPVYRSFLHASLDTQDGARVPRRSGHRLRWIRTALAPIKERLGESAFNRLVVGLSLVIGIEGIVVFHDVCELNRDEGEEVARWVARVLVAATLAESPEGASGGSSAAPLLSLTTGSANGAIDRRRAC